VLYNEDAERDVQAVGVVMKIVDFRIRFRTAFCLPEYIPSTIPGYELYIDHYKMRDRISEIPVQEQIELMLEAGIEKAVVCSPSLESNKIIYELSKRFPGRLCCFATANAKHGICSACDELKRAYEEYGFYGLSLGPYSTGLFMDDRRNYPLYAISESMGRIVNLHCSLHFNRKKSMKLGDPTRLDQIAMDFPEMNIVMAHAGNGFGDTPISVAMRHPTIYLDYSALRPHILGKNMLKAMNGFFQDRILWGSEYPLLSYDSWQEWEKYLKPEIMPKFLNANAVKLLSSVEDNR